MSYDQYRTTLQNYYSPIHSRLDQSPTGMLCAQSIKWTEFGGNRNEVMTDYHFTPREARKSALRSAIKSGWTPPRWWQWWRWGDTRVNLDFTDVQKREG
jgi:hypothetical protein